MLISLIGHSARGRLLQSCIALSYFGYLLLEKAGLFRVLPATWREAFHSLPSRFFSLVFVLLALVNMAAAVKWTAGRQRIGRVLANIAILLFAVALWTSYFTRFEGKVIRAEGETFGAFPGDYIRESVFRARAAHYPQIGITLLKVNPKSAADPMKLIKVDADILYAGRTTGRVLEGRLSSRRPLFSDWTLVSISDFGYMPKYVLSDLKEVPLESDKVYLKLYPPGAEEYFRTMYLGYLFYLRCYPDYYDDHGKPATLSALPKNPLFTLRIVRNKDIVYNGLVKPTEKVRFDNVVISVPDVKMWVELNFVRDPGYPIAAAAGGLFIAAITLLSWRGRKKTGIQ